MMNQETPIEQPSSAWQPFTFSGVAAFARASMSRLLVVEIVFALLAGVTVVWCLAHCYSPVVAQAIQKLPEEALLRDGKIEKIPGQILIGTRFFSIVVDLEGSGEFGQSGDLQLELHRNDVRICSLLRSAMGYLVFSYPRGVTISLGRSKLEPWWGAWQPMLLAGAGVATVVGLFVLWAALALLYAPLAWFLAFFSDRDLSWGGAWRLASAALMPGALLMALAILLYSWQALDLIGLLVIMVIHLIVGWIYLAVSPLFTPRLVVIEKKSNPFSC